MIPPFNHFAILLIITTAISACSPLKLINATVTKEGYRTAVDISYGQHPRQKLDVHVPTSTPVNGDVVIFYYGGRWQSGDKHDYRFAAQGFTSKGYITVIPDYQLYPHVRFPVFNKDAALAYKWVEKNISQYKGKPRRLFVAGHSSGAYLASMIALNEQYLKNAGANTIPCGTIGIAGPYDFLPFKADDLIAIFTTSEHPSSTQPISFVDGKENPFLILMGKDDSVVKEHNSPNLHHRIIELGGKSKLIQYEDVDHSGILIALSTTFRSIAPVLDDANKFIQRTRCE